MTRLLCGAATATLAFALASMAQPVQAQSYDRLVVLGDSLSDNGNLYMATGGSTPASPPYYQGRFSNGPTFAERLGFNASNFMGPVTGSINMAFGGARTDSQAAPLGMRLQLQQYMARGGRFGSGDLVSVLGGANNLFQGLPAAGASANPTGAFAPVATAAAADITSIVGSVAQAGAETILVTNLPKLSLTPQFRGTAGAPLADYGVTTFNTALQTGLASVAAANANTNIIQMDLFKIGDVVAANPSAFGVSNVTQACFNQTAMTVCSNPDDYFYFDGVHPTAKGHAVMAALAMDYLYYGDHAAQSALQGEAAWRLRRDALETGTASLSGRDAWTAGTQLTLTGLYDQQTTDGRGTIGKADAEGYGLRLALESGNETLKFGLAGSYHTSDTDSVSSSFDLESFGLDLYAGWRSGNVFVNGAVGASNETFKDISRQTQLTPVIHFGKTDGLSAGARVQAGAWFDQGGFALSPRVALGWVKSDVDGYVEQGAAAQLAYDDRAVTASTAEVALRAEAGEGDWRFFVEGGYRDLLSDDSEAVRAGIAGNTAKVLSREIDLPYGGEVMASAGLNGRLGERLKVAVGYQGRFGDQSENHIGSIRFTLPL
jgi:outer membrane lipase/esterase